MSGRSSGSAEAIAGGMIVAFALPEQHLTAVAGQYLPGSSPLWRFRFKAQNGLDWEDRMSPAEAAGMVEAARRYRAARGLAAD